MTRSSDSSIGTSVVLATNYNFAERNTKPSISPSTGPFSETPNDIVSTVNDTGALEPLGNEGQRLVPNHFFEDENLAEQQRVLQPQQPLPLQTLPGHNFPFSHRKNQSHIPNCSAYVTTNRPDNLDQPLANNKSIRHSWHPDSIRRQSQYIPESYRNPPAVRNLAKSRHPQYSASSRPRQMATTAPLSNYPNSTEEWKERGAANIIKTETDANGRVSTRVIKKGVQDFELGRTLGIGSYSTVVSATDKQNQKSYAIKILDKRHIIKEKKVKYVDIEKNTLHRLGDHPGIVSLYYTFQDESSLYFVLDFAANGELLSLIKKVCIYELTSAISNTLYRWALLTNYVRSITVLSYWMRLNSCMLEG